MSSRATKPRRPPPGDSSDSTKQDGRASENEERSRHWNTTDDRSSESGEEGDEDDFAAIGLKELWDLDPRPTFVIGRDTVFDNRLNPIFSNASLRSNQQLLKSLSMKTTANSQQFPKTSRAEFGAWMKSIAHLEDAEASSPTSFSFWGFLWTGFHIRKRWIVVSGMWGNWDMKGISSPHSRRSESPNSVLSEAPRENQNPPFTNSRTNSDDSLLVNDGHLIAEPRSLFMQSTPDWTRPQPETDLSPHTIFARSIDWSSTPLGDMSSWTPEFRQVACLLMSNPHPAALFWGEELTVIYNKAYADGVAGHKHPQLMGTGFRGPFAELWDSVSAIFNECRQTGKSVAVANQMLPITRKGSFLEETYFTWSLTPLYGGTDKLLGLYNAPFETTRQTINDRRTGTLLKLGEELALAKTVSNFWQQILKPLEDNEFDFPFALLYSVLDDVETDDDGSISSDSSQSMKSCRLEGTLGVPEAHPAAPSRVDLKRGRGGFVQNFRDAMQTREPKLFKIADGSLSEAMMEGFEWRGFKEPCKLAVTCPIRPTTGESVLGFLMIGINPRRPYDDDYQAFISLLNRQLATSLASVALFEEEIQRGATAAEAAALERSRLSEELAVQRSRLQRIAEVSPVGIFSLSSSGLLLEANDRWFEMTGHPRDSENEVPWTELFMDSSIPIFEAGWSKLAIDGISWSSELQLKKSWHDPITGEEVDNWILAAFQPEFTENATVKTIIGSITDITFQKRSAMDAETRARLSEQLLLRTQEAEALQKQRLYEAEETRRQQNNFIDITSHEMRNPLSAIVQCADSIWSSMNEYKAQNPNIDSALATIIMASIDFAETIQLCAAHQKSIVDDVLTISKLDSNLLVITPVSIRPIKIMEQCSKIFKSEARIADIKMEFHIDDSLQQLKIDRVMLDSSRLLQVLINLLTNAIKFTKSERKRAINVSLSAHLKPPADAASNFRYFPTKDARSDITAGQDWGTGEILYLWWEVRDTGCGLTENETKNLFTRFSQASPRTYVKYGGSGLGLFISRQLTELQGGEIGVASEAGVGSTFAFYLKARRSESEVSDVAELQLRADLESNARLPSRVMNRIRDERTSPAKALQDRRELVGPSSPTTSPPHPTPWYVLIVEDNLVNQRILAHQIRKLGCTVYVANHGEEALDLLRKTKYYKGREDEGNELSVILMDLEMPVMDGLTCARRIREMETEGLLRVRLPIIAVTANARAEQIAAAKDSGMDDVMPKPFRILQLVPKIEALLNNST